MNFTYTLDPYFKVLKNKKIGVLMGGRSAEREVSLRSGRGVLSALKRMGFDATPIDPSTSLDKKLAKSRIEVAFLAVHGQCGRTFIRMERVSDRTDNLIIIRGVKIFPSRFEEILSEMVELPEWKLVIENINNIDEVTLQVAISDKLPYFDEVRKLEQLKGDIIRLVRKELNVSIKVHFVESALCDNGAHSKECRVVDLRK